MLLVKPIAAIFRQLCAVAAPMLDCVGVGHCRSVGDARAEEGPPAAPMPAAGARKSEKSYSTE